MAENVQKMRSRLKNYPQSNLVIEKYGADALRYYLLTSPVMKAENLRFSEKGVDEVLKKFILTLWNVYSFLVMNAEPNTSLSRRHLPMSPSGNDVIKSPNLLDKWILSEFNILAGEVNKQMEDYDLARAARPLREFVDKLSNWYVRRSRKRFTDVGTRHCLVPTKDKNFAFQTLHYVLIEYSKLLAPFMPFIAEEIYQNLTGKESVHLEDFPIVNKNLVDEKVSNEMNFVRDVVTMGLSIRAKNSLKVRQPLSELRIEKNKDIGYWMLDIKDELINLIKDELNIKEIEFVDEITKEDNWICEDDGKIKIALNVEITEELKLEGQAREIVRHIQVMRKGVEYGRNDKILIKYDFIGDNEDIKKVFEEWGSYIKRECLAKSIKLVDELTEENFDSIGGLKVGDKEIRIGIKDGSVDVFQKPW